MARYGRLSGLLSRLALLGLKVLAAVFSAMALYMALFRNL